METKERMMTFPDRNNSINPSISGIQFRIYKEPFIIEVKRWFTSIAVILKEQQLLFFHGGPIILSYSQLRGTKILELFTKAMTTSLFYWPALAQLKYLRAPLIMCRSSPEKLDNSAARK
eukprot:jgi/Galph1/3585/GphlegSOOS_G2313.1